MGRWQRVATSRWYLFAGGGIAVAGAVGLGLTLARLPVIGLPEALFWAVVQVVLIALAARRYRMGVYYGERGVQTRTWLRNRTVPWDSVRGFEMRWGQGRPWTDLVIPARTLWIVCRDGTEIQTQIGYVAEEMIPPSSRAHLASRQRQRNSWAWSQTDCETALAELRREQQRHDGVWSGDWLGQP